MPYGLFDYTPESTIHTMGQTPVKCPMDVRRCPDGSFVSRVGPTCNFKPCPPPKPKCPPTTKVGNCNYRLI